MQEDREPFGTGEPEAVRPPRSRRAATGDGKAKKSSRARRSRAGSPRKPSTEARTSAEIGLQKDLREFVREHPGGWGHGEWIELVNRLREQGHDTSDPDTIGMLLERERLAFALEGVPGLGPRRIAAIADRFPRVWNLMQAGSDEIATVANIPRSIAQRVRDVIEARS